MATLQRVVPANVRAEMTRRGVTQVQVAAALGITQQAVSQKINGRRPLTDVEITVIARLLEVEPGVLFAEVIRSAS